MNHSFIPGTPVPIIGGQGDGSTFFICQNFVAVNAFDLMQRALPVGSGESRAFIYGTFLGQAEGGKPGGVTLIIPYEATLALLPQMRRMVSEVPMHLRGTGPFPGQADPFEGLLR